MSDERQLVVGAAVVRDGRVLAARRMNPRGKWEFPGGKAEAGENPLDALRRELHEELSLHVRVGQEIPGPVDGSWPINAGLRLRIWFATAHNEPRLGGDHDAVTWSLPDDLPTLDWLPADTPIADRIARQPPTDEHLAAVNDRDT